MKTKEWHIWNFPNNVYVLIEKSTREEFFKAMYNKFGSQKEYAKYLNKDRSDIQGYHYARGWDLGKKHVKFMPLKILHKSLPFINKKLKSKIENNILEIHAHGGKSIINPILPIKESPALYRIIAHLIGDGNDSHTPYYSNTCKELREQFKKDLQIFGKVKYYESQSTQNPNVIYVNFPKTITRILSHIFNIKFTHPDRLPKILFNSSKECKAAFLQALFDDEGTISTNLSICIKDKRLLNETKDLLKDLDIQTTKISVKQSGFGDKTHTFNIKSKSINTFKDKINFLHPKKHRRLETKMQIIERNVLKRTRPLEWTRKEILRLLKRKPRTTMELCESLLLTTQGLYPHLGYLEEKELINREGYKNKILWKKA